MLGDLIRRLTAETDPAPISHDDARMAMAALMVRLARADESYSATERDRIERVLATTYELSPAAAGDLRRRAEAEEAEAADTVRFTRAIKAAVAYEHRRSVVEALWQVAAADGIDADERGFLRLVANLLGVSDQDSGRARQRALREERS